VVLVATSSQMPNIRDFHSPSTTLFKRWVVSTAHNVCPFVHSRSMLRLTASYQHISEL
jgi:hypothetical protein